jgi:hypothetical protein
MMLFLAILVMRSDVSQDSSFNQTVLDGSGTNPVDHPRIPGLDTTTLLDESGDLGVVPPDDLFA